MAKLGQQERRKGFKAYPKSLNTETYHFGLCSRHHFGSKPIPKALILKPLIAHIFSNGLSGFKAYPKSLNTETEIQVNPDKRAYGFKAYPKSLNTETRQYKANSHRLLGFKAYPKSLNTETSNRTQQPRALRFQSLSQKP